MDARRADAGPARTRRITPHVSPMFENAPWWLAFATLLFPLIYLVVPAGIFYLILRFIRAYERRGQTSVAATDAEARLALLEEQMTRLGGEMERLAEGQRFTNALLAGRPAEAGPADARFAPPDAP